MINSYLAPALTDHGLVVARTALSALDVSKEGSIGARAASGDDPGGFASQSNGVNESSPDQ
jgi:hypothetical protein